MQKTLFVTVCFISFFLIACSDVPATTPYSPTVDIGALETRVAASVFATQTADAPPEASLAATNTRPTTSPSATSISNQSVLGKRFEAGGLGITILQVEMVDDFGEYVDPPEAGHIFLDIEVLIENLTAKSVSINALEFRIKDSEGFTYDAKISGSLDPSLHVDDLLRGEKARGHVGFELKKEAEGLTVFYNVIENGARVIERPQVRIPLGSVLSTSALTSPTTTHTTAEVLGESQGGTGTPSQQVTTPTTGVNLTGAERAYLAEAGIHTQNIADRFEAFNTLAKQASADNALFFDDDWTATTIVVLASFKLSANDLRSLNPPTNRMLSLQGKFLRAADYLDKIATSYVEALDSFDADKAREAGIYMEQLTSLTESIQQELHKYLLD